MEFKCFLISNYYRQARLKVLSYWNLNNGFYDWFVIGGRLKVLSYWNLNGQVEATDGKGGYFLKYYHIGI